MAKEIEEIEGNGCTSAPVMVTIQGTECVIRVTVAGNDQSALDRLQVIKQVVEGLLA